MAHGVKWQINAPVLVAGMKRSCAEQTYCRLELLRTTFIYSAV